MSRRQLKIGFWGSILFILITFVIIAYQSSIPIQFTNNSTRSNYYLVLVLAIPVACWFTVAFYYWLGEDKNTPVVHTICALVMSIILFISAGLLNFISSSWLDEQLLFKGRFSHKEVIQQHDGWNGKIRTVKSTPIIPGLRYITPIDTACLPAHKWVSVSQEEGYIAW